MEYKGIRGIDYDTALDFEFEQREERMLNFEDLIESDGGGLIILKESEPEEPIDSSLYLESEEEYFRINGIELPLITVPEESGEYIGDYAAKHLIFAEEHFFATVDEMSSTGELYDYLYDFNQKCLDKIVELEASGISKQEAEDIVIKDMVNQEPISKFEREVLQKYFLKDEYKIGENRYGYGNQRL